MRNLKKIMDQGKIPVIHTKAGINTMDEIRHQLRRDYDILEFDAMLYVSEEELEASIRHDILSHSKESGKPLCCIAITRLGSRTNLYAAFLKYMKQTQEQYQTPWILVQYEAFTDNGGLVHIV